MLTEFLCRGELMRMDLSTADFCPECCGPIGEAVSSRDGKHLRCQSCGLVFLPAPEPPEK